MRYTGLMISGPRDGEWFTHVAPRIEFVENGRAVRRPWGIMHVDFNGPICSTFIHVTDHTAGQFWVPEGKTVGWAVQELIEVYRGAQGIAAEQ